MENSYSQSRAPALALVRGRTRGRIERADAERTDAELVAASRRDPEAFTRLFERHWEGLYRFCLGRAGSAGEDIAAEAFRVAFDRRRRYDVRYSDARPWLFGIATNLLSQHFRIAKLEQSKRERSAPQAGTADDDGDIGGLERRMLGPELTAALQGIPAADRDALLLLAWADLDYEQISKALEIPVGTVRSRIHRARRRMRAQLQAGGNRQASEL